MPLPADLVQFESALKVQFVRQSDLDPTRSVAVGWFWDEQARVVRNCEYCAAWDACCMDDGRKATASPGGSPRLVIDPEHSTTGSSFSADFMRRVDGY